MLESIELYVALNIFLVLFLAANTYLVYRTKFFFFLQPAVISSILHFTLSYSIPNFYFLFSGSSHELVQHLPVGRVESLNRAMLAINLAAICLWMGYGSNQARHLSQLFRERISKLQLLQTGISINFFVVFALVLLSVLGPIIQIRAGTFGYFADAKGLKESQSITQWINLLSAAGKLALLVLSIAINSPNYKRSAAVWCGFLAVLAFQVMAGLCAGFKGASVMPFLIVIVGTYLVRRKMPILQCVVLFFAIVLAYQLVEPLRRARLESRQLDNRSIESVLSTCLQSFSRSLSNPDSSPNDKNDYSFSTEGFVSRLDLTTVTAISICFVDDGRLDPANSPAFLMNLVLVPLNAFIPRFLWENKTVTNDGWWYNVYVLGSSFDVNSSVGMGPVSYLYFTGGYLGIAIGFWVIGFFQQAIFRSLAGTSLGSWIVYIGILFPLTSLDSNLAASAAGILRLMPFLIIAQLMITKRRPRLAVAPRIGNARTVTPT